MIVYFKQFPKEYQEYIKEHFELTHGLTFDGQLYSHNFRNKEETKYNVSTQFIQSINNAVINNEELPWLPESEKKEGYIYPSYDLNKDTTFYIYNTPFIIKTGSIYIWTFNSFIEGKSYSCNFQLGKISNCGMGILHHFIFPTYRSSEQKKVAIKFFNQCFNKALTIYPFLMLTHNHSYLHWFDPYKDYIVDEFKNPNSGNTISVFRIPRKHKNPFTNPFKFEL